MQTSIIFSYVSMKLWQAMCGFVRKKKIKMKERELASLSP
jgi:hypothetical protein